MRDEGMVDRGKASGQVTQFYRIIAASLVVQSVKNLPAVQDTQVRFLGSEGPLEKEMATHSSILSWKIPWTEGTGGLQFLGSQEPTTTQRLNHHINTDFCLLVSPVAEVGTLKSATIIVDLVLVVLSGFASRTWKLCQSLQKNIQDSFVLLMNPLSL